MIVNAVATESTDQEEKIKEYTKAEVELNSYIRNNFPEWECKEILG